MYYVEHRDNLADNKTQRNVVVPVENLYQKVEPYNDSYRSMFLYDESILAHVAEKGSVSGYNGKVYAPQLVFDFDSTDLDQARLDTLELVRRLIEEYDVKENEVSIYFSGRKGYHIEISSDNIRGLDHQFHQNTPLFVKRMCLAIGKDLATLDRGIYNSNRLYRIAGTLHNKESTVNGKSVKLFKTNLKLDFLKEHGTEDIQKYSMTMQIPSLLYPVTNTEKLSALADQVINQVEDVTRDVSLPVLNQVGIADENLAPARIKTCMWRLYQGDYTGGRNNALLRVADHEKKQGKPQEVVKATLYGVLDIMNRRDPVKAKVDPMSDQEIDTIVRQVFTTDIDFGCFDEVLNSLCSKKCYLAPKKFNESKADTVTIAEAYKRSKQFYKQYNENLVQTGFKTLDEKMPLLLSTFNLIVGTPGCHAKGTEILMYDGSIKKVEDVLVGDKLMGPDSSPREVLKLASDRQEMVKIIPTKGEPFVVNLDHMLSLQPSGKSMSVNHVVNITVREYLKQNKNYGGRLKLYRTGVTFNKNEKLLLPPYILGTWLGDGTSSKPELTTMDSVIEKAWAEYSQQNNCGFRTREVLNNKAKTLIITSTVMSGFGKKKVTNNHLMNSLRAMDLIKNKHIPLQYLTASRIERLEVLAGIIDTDGHKSGGTSNNGSGYEISTISDQLNRDILFLARSLGFAAYSTKSRKECVNNGVWGEYHRIYISGQTNLIPVRLERKKCNPRKQIKDVLRTGFTVEHLPEDQYFGFSLDKDHLYLTSDFTVHHNTGKTSVMLNLLKNASEAEMPALFFNMDMSEEMLIQRAAPIFMYDRNYTGSISGTDFMEAHANGDEALMKRAEDAFAKVSENVLISSQRSMTVKDIEQEIDKQEKIWGRKIKLVIVDYVQLLKSDKEGHFNDQFNAEALTTLAKTRKICVLGLSQSTESSNAPNGANKGEYNNAKGSRTWLDQASTQINCFRPFKDTHPEYDHIITARMIKNRLGDTSAVSLYFHGASGIVRDLTYNEQMEFEALKQQLQAQEE